MGIAERMIFLRERSGLSVEETAALFGLSSTTVVRWEAGVTRPKGHNVKAAADYYGVSAEWILAGVYEDDVQTLSEQDTDDAGAKFFALYTGLPDAVRSKFAAYFSREFGELREVAQRGGDIGRQASQSA